MDNSTDIEQLMRYLDGEHSEAERKNFEQRLKDDIALKQELENLEMAREAVRSYGLKEKLTGIHGEMMKELAPQVKRIRVIRRYARISIAIAASILLVFLTIEAVNFYRLSPNKLYSENYTPYELTSLRGEQTTPSLIEKAYDEKRYEEVIRLNNTTVLSIKDIFLTGIAYLETGENLKAISSFQVVITDLGNDKQTALKEAAEYYLALAYLKNRDFDPAIELMSKIHEDPSHLYKEKFTRNFINRVKRLKWR